jgi:hypothetical protein
MGRFTKRLVVGLVAALTAGVGGASADFLLDDLEGGTNENKMGYYWYYYVGDDIRTGEKLARNTPDGYKKIITNAQPGDAYGAFSFVPYESGYNNSTGSAAMIYENLSYANKAEVCGAESGCEYYPTIGVGTSLTAGDDIGYGSEFANVDSVVFWMKTKNVAQVNFKLETIENSVNGPFGPTKFGTTPVDGKWFPENQLDLPGSYDRNPANAYMKAILVTTADDNVWKRYAVGIKPVVPPAAVCAPFSATCAPTGKAGELMQDAWWGYSFEFKPANVTKIAWQINNDKNTQKAGEILVDNITLVGPNFTYTPPDQCTDCHGKTLPDGAKMKIGDFEGEDALQNPLGYYWYSYTDEQARTDGSTPTAVTCCWTTNAHTGAEVLAVEDNDTHVGFGNGSKGVKISYTIGDNPFEQNRDGVKSSLTAFAGIGTNLFDSTTFVFTNATGATGLYFEYKTSDVDFLAVEFSDRSDVQNAGPDSDNDDGQVYYLKVPGSADWTGAIIPAGQLVLPRWIKEGDRRYGTTLNWSQLGKVQFKYQGAANGSISIDNVYLLGIDGPGDPNLSVKLAGSKAKVSGLRATYSRGVIGVNWNTSSSIAGGKVQLVNTKGRVVASAPIGKSAGKVTASIGAGRIPTGMYFVRLNARDASGKKVVQQTALSIVK